jgi:hypothetical protein
LVDKRLSRKIAANSFIHGCFKENETRGWYLSDWASQNLFYSNFLSYICKGQGSFEDNLWVYMGFNNFPRPTFKVTTLCQDGSKVSVIWQKVTLKFCWLAFTASIVLSTYLIDMTWNNLLNQQKENGGMPVILVESYNAGISLLLCTK